MNVTISAIDNPAVVASRQGTRLTRFDIDFQTSFFAGKAYLFILNSSPQIDMDAVRKQVASHTFQLEAAIENISDFESLSKEGHEQVIPLGPRGAFFLEGRITQHLFTGEGSLFQVGEMVLQIDVDTLPPYSLEVEEGSWVRFKAERLTFFLR